MPLTTRHKLSAAALTLRHTASQPMVFVQQPTKLAVTTVVAKTPRIETLEQVELRRARVEAITRVAPKIVITSNSVYVLDNQLDAVNAVPMKLPWITRLKNWMKRAD